MQECAPAPGPSQAHPPPAKLNLRPPQDRNKYLGHGPPLPPPQALGRRTNHPEDSRVVVAGAEVAWGGHPIPHVLWVSATQPPTRGDETGTGGGVRGKEPRHVCFFLSSRPPARSVGRVLATSNCLRLPSSRHTPHRGHFATIRASFLAQTTSQQLLDAEAGGRTRQRNAHLAERGKKRHPLQRKHGWLPRLHRRRRGRAGATRSGHRSSGCQKKAPSLATRVEPTLE